jgi:hypothetical protein
MRFALPRYAGYSKGIHSHILHIIQYEGDGAYLIADDSTGDSTIVSGMPIVSREGKRFVLTSIAGEFHANAIEVWRMIERKPVKEFSYESQGWSPSDARWRDSATIDFVKVSSDSPAGPFTKRPGRLTLVTGKWVLSDKTR